MDRIERLKDLIPKLKSNNKIQPLKIECLEWELKFLESERKQLFLHNVSNAKQDCFGKEDLRYVYENVDTGYMSFEDWFKEYTLPI